jgi:hypothetical protein
VILMLADAGVLLRFQWNLTFFVDEWQLLVERRRWDLDAFLRPLYEHLFLVPVAVFKVLMLAVGIGPRWVYGLPLIAMHLTCVALVYVLARSRLGPWFALAPAALILFLGSSVDNMLLPIQISFLASTAAGLGMLLAFDGSSTRRRDGTACILLGLSLASSSLGLSFVVAALAEVLTRQSWTRRLWIVLVPVLVYAAWFVVYGPTGLQQGGDLRGNVPFVPAHMAAAAAAVLGALAGLDLAWGRVLAVAGALFVLGRVLSGERLSPRVISLGLAVLVFWSVGGLARAHQHDPDASRYLYPAAVYIVLIGVEFLRPVRLGTRWAAVLAVGVAFAAIGNANSLRGARDSLQGFTRMLSAQFAALEVLGRENVPPDFVAAVDLAPGISAEDYFEMVDDLGSPVDGTQDLLHAPEEDRRRADAVLAQVLAATAQRSPNVNLVAPRPDVESIRFGRATLDDRCVRFDSASGGEGSIVVTARGPVVLISALAGGPLEVSVRRFGGHFHPVGRLSAGSSRGWGLPSGDLPTPWRLRLSGRAGAEVCSAAFPAPG